MGFLNTAYLFGLAAAAIPLILHFLSKRRITTIEFSSLRFLQQMQKSRMKWLRIKEILLLLMRMLIIALIVMAFARPTLKGFIGSSKASSSVAILLDRSASMETQGETGSLFDEARRTAVRLAESLEPGDMISVLPFPDKNSPEDPLNQGTRLYKEINTVEAGYGADGIGKALGNAFDILGKSPDLNREIYILSDFQRNGWDNLPPEVLSGATHEGINLTCIPMQPSGPANVAITDIIMPPQILVPGENFEISAELVNYGSGTLENALVGIIIDGERKAQATVSLRPEQTTQVTFNIRLDNSGKRAGYFEIDYDRYAPDNRRYFTLDIPERIKLLAVGQSESALRILSLALNRPEAGQIEYKGIGAGDLLKENLDSYDVILLNDLKNLDIARESAIEKYLESGGGLFIALGQSGEREYWNTFLLKIGGISVGNLEGNPGEFIMWDKFDFEHPIFSIYSNHGADRAAPEIPDIHIVRYSNLEGGRILGSSSTGINLLADSRNKPLLVYSSGLDLATGDIPAHSFFVPLLVRSIEYLGLRNSGIGQDGIIGQPYSIRLTDITEGLRLISPSGETTDLNSGNGNTMVNFTVDGVPGIYKLSANEKTISQIAFNVNSDESNGDVISSSEIGEMLGLKSSEIENGGNFATSIKNARFGRELWKEFILAALLLLIVESILGRTAPPKTAGEPV